MNDNSSILRQQSVWRRLSKRIALRSPYVVVIFRQQVPLFMRIPEGSAVSCFLSKDNPALGARGLDEVLEVTQGTVATAAD